MEKFLLIYDQLFDTKLCFYRVCNIPPFDNQIAIAQNKIDLLKDKMDGRLVWNYKRKKGKNKAFLEYFAHVTKKHKGNSYNIFKRIYKLNIEKLNLEDNPKKEAYLKHKLFKYALHFEEDYKLEKLKKLLVNTANNLKNKLFINTFASIKVRKSLFLFCLGN